MNATKSLCMVGLVALLLLGWGGMAGAQTPAQWYQEQLEAMNQSQAIMERANQRGNLLAAYQVMRHAYAADDQRAFRAIFGQYLSWYQTFIGDYKDAELSFSIAQRALPGDRPSPLGQPGWRAVPALEAIPRLAKNRRVVFLNEAHNIALTRTLTVRLLKPLRAEGFNVFAAETLYHSGITALNKRGYPIAASGFYTREPICAEMVRTALRLGYRVIAYEAGPNQHGDAREAAQAENLWKVLKDDPSAKLVVDSGYAHIQKTGKFLGAQSMAEHFIEDSALDPLSVEQTFLVPHQNRSLDHPDYEPIIQALHPEQPIVFVNKDGKPWSLRPGYDASVIFPQEHFVYGRPTWLGLWGARVPITISGTVCRQHWPCMVAARYADEASDAIPADRMVLDLIPLMTVGDIKVTTSNSVMPVGQLYLRPGYRYRITVTDVAGTRIGSSTITVSRTSGDPPILKALPPAAIPAACPAAGSCAVPSSARS